MHDATPSTKRLNLPLPLLLFALVYPTVGTLAYFVLAADETGQSLAFRITYAVVKVLQFAWPVVFLLVVNRQRLKRIRLSVRGLGGGVVFGGLTLMLILAMYFGAMRDGSAFDGVAREVQAKVAGFGVTSRWTYIGFVIFLAVLHSLLEEYYWRWFVYGALRERCSQACAILVSATAFMAHHVVVLNVYFPNHFLQATLPFSLGVAFGGGVWAWWYERTGSLAGAWVAHIFADLGIMAVGYDLLYC